MARHHHHATVTEVIVFHDDDDSQAGKQDYLFRDWTMTAKEPCQCDIDDPFDIETRDQEKH